MTREEWVDANTTKGLASDTYAEITSRAPQPVDTQRFPVVVRSFKDKTGGTVEIRRTNRPLQYVRYDENGDIARDASGMALYLTDAEAKAKGLPTVTQDMVAVVDGLDVASAFDSFGVPEVLVQDQYQRRGIGTELLKEYQRVWKRDGFGQATPQGRAMIGSLHRESVQSALASGKPVPPEVLADYPDLALQAPPQRPTDAPQTPPTDTPDGDEKAIRQRAKELVGGEPLRNLRGLLRTAGQNSQGPAWDIRDRAELLYRQQLRDAGFGASDLPAVPDSARDVTRDQAEKSAQNPRMESGVSSVPTPSAQKSAESAPRTTVEELRASRAKVESRQGKVYANNIERQAARLLSNVGDELHEYRSAGYVTRSGDGKYTLHVLAGTDSPPSKWRIASTIDVTEQYVSKAPPDPPPPPEVAAPQDTGTKATVSPAKVTETPRSRRPNPGEFSEQDVRKRARNLLDRYDYDPSNYASEWDTDADQETTRSLAFVGKLPTEIKMALQGKAHLRPYFQVSRGYNSSRTGADTLGDKGADWMVEQAQRMYDAERKSGAAFDRELASIANADPEAALLRLLLTSDRTKPQRVIDNPEGFFGDGDTFSMGGRAFKVTDGQWGKEATEQAPDGKQGVTLPLGAFPSIPIDSRSHVKGESAPKPGEKVEQWAARVAEQAKARRAARAKETAALRKNAKPGERIGAAPIIGDLVDHAIELTAAAIQAGARGGRAFADYIRANADASMQADWRRLWKIGKGILADGTDENGNIDPAKVAASMAAVQASHANPDAKPPRKVAADAPKSVRAAQQVGRRSYADGVAAMRPKMDELRDRIRETRKGERSKAVEKQRAAIAKLEAKKAAGDAKAAAVLEKAKAKFTDLANADRVAKGIRKEIVDLVRENVPPSYQGRFLTTVRDAKTIDALADAIESINATIAKDRGRTQLARVRKMTGKKQLARVLDDQVLADIKAARDKAERSAADLKAAIERGDSDQAMNHADGMKAQADIIAENLAHAKALYQITVRGEIVRTAKVQAEVKANAEKRTKLRHVAPDGTAKEIDARWIVRTFRRQLTLKNLARIMDGSFSQQGPVQKVFADLFDASNARDARLVQMHDAADAALRRAGFGSSMEAAAVISGTLGRGARRTVNVSIPGITRRLTLGQALSIYARDPETKNRWTKGQPAILETAKGSKAFTLDQKKREEIEAAIPENLRRLVVDLKAIKDELFPDLDKAHRTLKGIRLQRVDDHWPIRLDRSDKATYAEGYRAMAQQHLENAGYLQERERASKAPIKIGDFLEEFFNHMESAVAIAHMAVPIRNAEVVMNARDVRESIARTLGESANNRIAEILQDASGLSSYGPPSKIGQASDRITRTVASNVSKAYTKVNPRSWLRQLGGVMMLRARLDNQDWAAGVRNVADKGMTERMSRATHVRVRYMQNYAMRASQADTSPSIESAPRKGDARRALNAIAKNAKVGSFPGAWKALGAAIDTVRIADWFDKIPVRVAWAALEHQAKREHPEWSAEQTQKWVEAEHRELIRDTQNTSGSMDGTGLNAMAARATLMRPFLAFTSDRMKALNLLIEAANSGDKAQIAKASEALLENMAWSAAVSSVTGKRGVMLAGAAVAGMLGMGWDWPDEEEADGFGETFVKSMGKDALGFVPLLGDAVNNLFDPMGTALDNPTSGTINDLKSAFQEFVRAVELTTDAEKRDRAKIGPLARVGRGVEKAALAGATLSGIPVAPGYRIIKNFVQGMLKEGGGSDDDTPTYIPYVRVGQATGSRARSLPMDSAGSMGPR